MQSLGGSAAIRGNRRAPTAIEGGGIAAERQLDLKCRTAIPGGHFPAAVSLAHRISLSALAAVAAFSRAAGRDIHETFAETSRQTDQLIGSDASEKALYPVLS